MSTHEKKEPQPQPGVEHFGLKPANWYWQFLDFTTGHWKTAFEIPGDEAIDESYVDELVAAVDSYLGYDVQVTGTTNSRIINAIEHIKSANREHKDRIKESSIGGYEIGKWYDWNGGECSIPGETPVTVVLRNGEVRERQPANWYRWKHSSRINGVGHDHDIVRFRIKECPKEEDPHTLHDTKCARSTCKLGENVAGVKYSTGMWHTWNGGECPVPDKTKIMVRLRDGVQLYLTTQVTDYRWSHSSPNLPASYNCDITEFYVIEYPDEADLDIEANSAVSGKEAIIMISKCMADSSNDPSMIEYWDIDRWKKTGSWSAILHKAENGKKIRYSSDSITVVDGFGNEHSYPRPFRGEPEKGSRFWIPSMVEDVEEREWTGSHAQLLMLGSDACHKTRDAALAQRRAIRAVMEWAQIPN